MKSEIDSVVQELVRDKGQYRSVQRLCVKLGAITCQKDAQSALDELHRTAIKFGQPFIGMHRRLDQAFADHYPDWAL